MPELAAYCEDASCKDAQEEEEEEDDDDYYADEKFVYDDVNEDPSSDDPELKFLKEQEAQSAARIAGFS